MLLLSKKETLTSKIEKPIINDLTNSKEINTIRRNLNSKNTVWVLFLTLVLFCLVACGDNATKTGVPAVATIAPSEPTITGSANPVTNKPTLTPQATPSTTSQPGLSLIGIDWKFLSYDENGVLKTPTAKASIAFKADGNFYGKDFCGNYLMGKYQTATNAGITIRDITSTAMACGDLPATGTIPDDLQLKNKETGILFNGLQAVKSYTITGGKLALLSSNGNILLEFSGS